MSSTVGNLTLPVPAGASGGALSDPTIVGLLAYLSYCIKADLDAKLAQMGGTSSDACVSTYPFNPSTYFVRDEDSFPALYLWWQGRGTVKPQTSIYDVRERRLECLYVFDELVAPRGLVSRSGLISAVDASIAKASERGLHASYTPSGYAPGTDILTALNLLRWEYEGGEPGFMAPIPGVAGTRSQEPQGGHVARGYPSLRGRFVVWERVGAETLADPGDVLGDILVDLETNEQGDIHNTVDILSGYLMAPDGSEIDDE